MVGPPRACPMGLHVFLFLGVEGWGFRMGWGSVVRPPGLCIWCPGLLEVRLPSKLLLDFFREPSRSMASAGPAQAWRLKGKLEQPKGFRCFQKNMKPN